MNWLQKIFDPEFEKIERLKKQSLQNKTLLILTWDTYSRITVPYVTQGVYDCIDFFLEQTNNKPQYLYEVIDNRPKEDEE